MAFQITTLITTSKPTKWPLQQTTNISSDDSYVYSSHDDQDKEIQCDKTSRSDGKDERGDKTHSDGKYERGEKSRSHDKDERGEKSRSDGKDERGEKSRSDDKDERGEKSRSDGKVPLDGVGIEDKGCDADVEDGSDTIMYMHVLYIVYVWF